MEAQELYNLCAGHLLKQGRQSLDRDGLCAYRGDDGLKCVAGAAIPDRLYDSMMEMRNIEYVTETFEGLDHLIEHKAMLSDLQALHDCMTSETLYEIFGVYMTKQDILREDGTFIASVLKEGLDIIANRYGLEPLPALEG